MTFLLALASVFSAVVSPLPQSLPNRENQQSIKLRERSLSAREAFGTWNRGGNSAEAIGTLRTLAEGMPRHSGGIAFDLARILQSEGRNDEAASWYWSACHTPAGGGRTRNPLGLERMVRIVDALEDVGRYKDAEWAIGEARASSRRELFLRQLDTGSDHPLWQQKWAIKLLKANSNDVAAKRYLERARRTLEYWKVHANLAPVTRDLPR